MKILPTFTAQINIGFKEGYDGKLHTFEEAVEICQAFCDKIGLGLTVTPTKFVYTKGNEDGCIVGLINYPRFPDTKDSILMKAIALAEIFLKEFKQNRISIVTTEQTVMIEQGDS